MTQTELLAVQQKQIDHVVETLNDRLNHEKQRLASLARLSDIASNFEDKMRLCCKMYASQRAIELLTDLIRDLT